MKQIYTSIKFAEIGLLKSLLEAEGIECVTRNQEIANTRGLVNHTGWYDPELWVLQDEDFDKANAILAAWNSSEKVNLAPWICPNCGEEVEGQYLRCWQCDTEKKEV